MTKSYPRLNDLEKKLIHQIFKGNRDVEKLATSTRLDLNAMKNKVDGLGILFATVLKQSRVNESPSLEKVSKSGGEYEF